MTGVAGKVGAAVHPTASDETLKTLHFGDACQSYKVAACESLAVIAAEAGYEDHASAGRTSMGEDDATDGAVDGMIEKVNREYLKFATGGQKADG